MHRLNRRTPMRTNGHKPGINGLLILLMHQKSERGSTRRRRQHVDGYGQEMTAGTNEHEHMPDSMVI